MAAGNPPRPGRPIREALSHVLRTERRTGSTVTARGCDDPRPDDGHVEFPTIASCRATRSSRRTAATLV